MQVLVENDWGVVEGADRSERSVLAEALHTEYEIVGNRFKFRPTRHALDYLVERYGREAFHSGCRFAWARFYKKNETKEVEFNFKTPPYPHQQEWWSRVRDMPYFAFEWDMGLGKTKTVLDILAWAAAQGELDGALVVTLKGVHRNWVERELPEHMPIPHNAAYWNPNRVEAGMRGLIDSDKFALAALNFDVVNRKTGNAFARKFLKARKAALIIDESHNIKTPTAARTKALHKLADLAERRYIMTGTLVTQSPLDAWAQYYFLEPRILNGMRFGAFKERYAEHQNIPGVMVEAWEYDPKSKRSVKVEREAREVVGFKNTDELKARLDPYRSRLLKSDVLDLPEKVYRLRSFEMSDEMRKAYVAMQDQLRVDLASGQTMTAQMAMTKLIRLQQIACGFVVPDDRDPFVAAGEALPGKNPRLQALMETCEEINGKGIIWASWRFSIAQIADALREAYGEASVVEYHGGVSDAQKTRAINEFQEGTPPWFVGNQMSGGTGITLTAAQDMVYYNNLYNLGLRKQSEDRFHRIGQTGTCTITDLEALGTVDRPQLRALRAKNEMAAELSGDILRDWLSAAG